MRYLLPTLLLCFSITSPSFAKEPMGEITDKPICFTVRNTAPYRVYGEFSTDYFPNKDGVKSRHTGTFRLEKAGTTNEEKDYPLDVSEFCSSGPFYPERQLELVLRSLFPIFSCKTSIELGEIVIHGIVKKEGGTKTWAVCY